MKLVGYWVVGDQFAKFGARKIGDTYLSGPDDTGYWKNRGYTLVPVYCEEADVEEWGTV